MGRERLDDGVVRGRIRKGWMVVEICRGVRGRGVVKWVEIFFNRGLIGGRW
jgi:hypothetical protein